jgi:hypothetical protein
VAPNGGRRSSAHEDGATLVKQIEKKKKGSATSKQQPEARAQAYGDDDAVELTNSSNRA